MNWKLVLRGSAAKDVLEVFFWYHTIRPELGDRFMAALRESYDSIQTTGLFLRCLPRQRRSCSNPPLRCFVEVQIKQKLQRHHNAGVLGGAKQPKSEPLPSGASLAAISSKVMVFVPSL